MGHISKRVVTFIAGAAVFGLLAGTGTAVGAALIDSSDIKNNSIKSVDVQDGTLNRKDLNSSLNKTLADGATKSELRAVIRAFDARLKALEAQDSTGANSNFTASAGSTIIDATTAELAQTTGGTSVEIVNLDLPVQQGQTVAFTYELKGGAVYAAGAPRIFYEIAGTYYNTFDGNPEDKGTANADGTFTKTVTIPTNGRIGALGIVNDSGTPGSIVVSDVTIAGYVVQFK